MQFVDVTTPMNVSSHLKMIDLGFSKTGLAAVAGCARAHNYGSLYRELQPSKLAYFRGDTSQLPQSARAI
jgi:hypothetical protein